MPGPSKKATKYIWLWFCTKHNDKWYENVGDCTSNQRDIISVQGGRRRGNRVEIPKQRVRSGNIQPQQGMQAKSSRDEGDTSQTYTFSIT
jgi:hypothetical protein